MNTALPEAHVVVFDGEVLIGSGTIAELTPIVRAAAAHGSAGPLLAFDSSTSELVELDAIRRGTVVNGDQESDSSPYRTLPEPTAVPSSAPAAFGPRSATEAQRGPGRPKLGVTAREVTLLPRHWNWLAAQPGGASAAIRRLIDQARTANAGRERVRLAQESAYRFMCSMLGNQPHFEEALRALFAADGERFTELTDPWPIDPRDHARRLASVAFQPS